MLVLVLILVVIALVLLLAGWFLHLVVLAWTSVGISVLAGLVLLYDWWQTRSAVRAGRQPGRDGDGDRSAQGQALGAGAVGAGVGAGAVGAGMAGSGAGPDAYGGGDMEPATQVLPIVPPPSNAVEETVVMPVVAPSGSPDAPSGASRSGGLSSPSVTESTADEGATTRATDGGTTAVDPAAGPVQGGGGDPATGSAQSFGDTREAPEGEADAAGAAGPSDPAEPATTAGRAGTTQDATQAVPSGAAGATAVGGAAVAGAAGVAAGSAGSAEDGTTRSDRATGSPDEPTSVADGGPPADADDRTRAEAAVDTSGEAPEEPRDSAHALLVARLPDEVVVIDEHPRYHVQGCPSLPGQPLIPLPVSEAVELGFTPCGWCSPNRVLSERHPAEAR